MPSPHDALGPREAELIRRFNNDDAEARRLTIGASLSGFAIYVAGEKDFAAAIFLLIAAVHILTIREQANRRRLAFLQDRAESLGLPVPHNLAEARRQQRN